MKSPAAVKSFSDENGEIGFLRKAYEIRYGG
jgi:hypothetical protein